jgi:hypothetical protein
MLKKAYIRFLSSRFEKKVKSKKLKHYSLDQTIEEALNELDYENILENVIKEMAQQKKSEFIRRVKEKCTTSRKEAAKLAHHTDEQVVVAPTQKHHRSHGSSSSKSVKTSRPEDSEIDLNEEEYHLLHHAFSLFERSNLNTSFKSVIGNYSLKFGHLIQTSHSELVQQVASMISFFSESCL